MLNIPGENMPIVKDPLGLLTLNANGFSHSERRLAMMAPPHLASIDLHI